MCLFFGDAYDLPISIFCIRWSNYILIIATISKSVEPLKIIKKHLGRVVWFSIGLLLFMCFKNGLIDYLAIILKELRPKK